MKRIKNAMLVIVSALVITILFYKQALGLNLLIYELLVMSYLYLSGQFQSKGLNQSSMAISVIFTAVFTVIHHSLLSFLVNFGVFFLFIGVVIAPEMKSIISALKLATANLFSSQAKFKDELINGDGKRKKFGYWLWRTRIFLIPLLIISLFILIYSWSNPKFDKIISNIGVYLQEKLTFIFEYISIWAVLVFLIGIVISSFIFLRVRSQSIIDKDSGLTDELIRKKTKWHVSFRILALKNEYKSAVFLFFSLNILLLLLNILDINHVWISFEWEGQHLKQFVHIGTYLLIAAIIISVVLVLHYFRKNLNFYRDNKWLKYLAYAWLIQNGILAISVGIRNWYYIHHFALAYKRIAVMFFLILAIYGLYTVFIKVMHRKSVSFILRTNAFAWVLVFVLAAGFNWDRIIARYNFRNANKSFVHLDFLSDLSDSALPYLDKDMTELAKIRVSQEQKFSFGRGSFGSYGKTYMTPERYHNKLQYRKLYFKRKWNSKGFLSWNWAEHKAYHMLFD